jgi:hypothetical protein
MTLPYRRSVRLPQYDYSQAGACFVTIYVQDRKCLLGEIRDESDLHAIRKYVVENPLKWDLDRENPSRY